MHKKICLKCCSISFVNDFINIIMKSLILSSIYLNSEVHHIKVNRKVIMSQCCLLMN